MPAPDPEDLRLVPDPVDLMLVPDPEDLMLVTLPRLGRLNIFEGRVFSGGGFRTSGGERAIWRSTECMDPLDLPKELSHPGETGED